MTKIGRYQVLSEINRGGMGIVYKAFDPLFERELAIKTMFDETCSEPSFRARFFREARSAGKLKHVNIVTVYDLGEENGRPYLVMEFLEGRDLRALIHEGERLTLEERLRIMLDICRGLAHAHSREVIHRDIKPSNIFVTTSGEVKILDFGLARTLSTITKSSELLGTPNYMSPEQWNREADHRSDIFAAGAVFYEMLTLRMAFEGDSFQRVMFKIINCEPEPMERVNPALPVELSAIVRKAISKDPDRRYQNIDELTRDLENLRDSLEERKSELKKELEEDLRKLVVFVDENRELLQHDGTKALANLDRPDDYLNLFELRDRVIQNLAILKTLANKRQQLAPLLSEAVEHERQGRLESAFGILEKILQEDPNNVATITLYANLNTRIEEQRLQRERESRAAECFHQAESKFESDDLPGCMACLEEALSLQPAHSAAAALQDAVQKILREKAEAARLHVQELAANAKSKISLDDLAGAREVLDELSRLDPGNQAAVTLREEVQHKLADRKEREARRRQAEASLSAAWKAVEMENFSLAREEAENARILHPETPGIGDLLEEIDRAEKKKNQRERLALHLVQSQQALSMQNFEEAGVRIREALRIDPENEDARRLLAKIDRAQEEAGRRVKIDALLVQSEQALLIENFQDAAIRAREVFSLDPQNSEAAELLDRISKAQEEKLQHLAETKSVFRKATPWVLAAAFTMAIALIAASPVRRLLLTERYGRITRDEFNRGRYEEANKDLDVWIAKDSQNNEARLLRSRTTEILASLKAFESALGARDYLAARGALMRVQVLNKSDPGMANRWANLDVVFSPEFLDEFLGGLNFWNAPKTWRVDAGRLIVRGTALGTLQGKHYEDFTASFNISFLNAKGAVWVLRASTDLSDYYMFLLTGPKGNPPNSFACFKSVSGKREIVLGPILVGANLSKQDDQFNITVKAVGDKVEHLIEIVSEPAEEPRPLASMTDRTISGGTIGFGAVENEEFVVRAFKVQPIRKTRTF